MKSLLFSIFLLFSIVLIPLLGFGQDESNFTKTPFQIKKVRTFDPQNFKPTYHPEIKSLEAPVPGGSSYRSHLLELKKEVRKKYPLRNTQEKTFNSSPDVEMPKIVEEFPLREYFYILDANGDTLYIITPGGDTTLKPEVRLISGGTPLDNTLAISNDDFLMCGINSKIYMHDLKTGKNPVRSNIQVISFADFAEQDSISTSFPFDPKIIYDPDEDRFILTFLSGRTPSDSKLIIGFSTSSNPTDPWNVYEIPGNPYNNGLWSDYPAISLSQKEVFYTINLLVPGSNWKTSFSETVIWQIDKQSGYTGQESLESILWGGVELDGRNLRNLAVVHGAEGLEGPNMYFLSNRNFDVTNDTTFLVEITDEIGPNAELVITPLIASQVYGLPPNGRQANSDPNDPDDGFDTNDARVLGAIKNKNEIQFVGNSVDTLTGHAAVYHGIISGLDGTPVIRANIIGHDAMDFGYPNIAYTGAGDCEKSTLIAFDHTSPTHYSGVSAIKYIQDENGNDVYSELMTLKEGEDIVEQINGSYERWGDYFGLQRKYDEPGVVYSAGFYGSGEDRRSATWFNILRDCECYSAEVTEVVSSVYNKCFGQITVTDENAVEPVKYVWNGNESDANYLDVNLCDYTYTLETSDAHGCEFAVSGESSTSPEVKNQTIFPNPALEDINIYFELGRDSKVSVYLYNLEGKVVQELVNEVEVSEGKNLLTFSVAPLSGGVYILKIIDGDTEILTEKIVKN